MFLLLSFFRLTFALGQIVVQRRCPYHFESFCFQHSLFPTFFIELFIWFLTFFTFFNLLSSVLKTFIRKNLLFFPKNTSFPRGILFITDRAVAAIALIILVTAAVCRSTANSYALVVFLGTLLAMFFAPFAAAFCEFLKNFPYPSTSIVFSINPFSFFFPYFLLSHLIYFPVFILNNVVGSLLGADELCLPST